MMYNVSTYSEAVRITSNIPYSCAFFSELNKLDLREQNLEISLSRRYDGFAELEIFDNDGLIENVYLSCLNGYNFPLTLTDNCWQFPENAFNIYKPLLSCLYINDNIKLVIVPKKNITFLSSEYNIYFSITYILYSLDLRTKKKSMKFQSTGGLTIVQKINQSMYINYLENFNGRIMPKY